IQFFTTAAEMDYRAAVGFGIFCVKDSGRLHLLIIGDDHDGVATIVVMEMKNRLIVSVRIGYRGGAYIRSRVLGGDRNIRQRLAVGPADIPFDVEPVICRMHGLDNYGTPPRS